MLLAHWFGFVPPAFACYMVVSILIHTAYCWFAETSAGQSRKRRLAYGVAVLKKYLQDI